MTADDSFFGHLTKLTDNNEATDLSRLLIKVVAYDACLAKRNTLTTYRLVERLRDVCNEIGNLITNVDGLTDSVTDIGKWDDYDKYTGAIDPLEEFLWGLLDFIDNEFLGKATTVKDVVDSVGGWKTSRDSLRNFASQAISVNKFGTLTSSVTTFDFENKHDDLVLLSALCNGINTHSLLDADIAGGVRSKAIKGVKDDAVIIAQEAKTKSPSEDSIVECIRCTMLVHGAMNLTTSLATVKSSAPVWEKAKELLKNVASHLKDKPQKVTVANLGTGWTELKVLLEKLEAELPEAYLALRKLAKTVRRPFHYRTLALVKMCRDLAEEFLKADKKIAANLPPLEAALTAATEALNKGKPTALAVVAGTGLTEIDDAFNTGATKVDECRTAYNLQAPNKGTTDLQAAETRDKAWIARLTSSKVAELEGKTLTSGPKVTVNVSYTIAGSPKTKQYEVDVDTQLSMILWKIVSEKTDAFPRDKLVGVYFEGAGTPPKKLAFNEKVGSNLDLTLKT